MGAVTWASERALPSAGFHWLGKLAPISEEVWQVNPRGSKSPQPEQNLKEGTAQTTGKEGDSSGELC